MPRVTSDGKVTIPKPIRNDMGIRPGDEITFEPVEGGYILTKKGEEKFDRWKGVAGASSTIEERMDAIRGDRE